MKEEDSLFGDDEDPAKLENPEKDEERSEGMEKLLEELSIDGSEENEDLNKAIDESPKPDKDPILSNLD